MKRKSRVQRPPKVKELIPEVLRHLADGTYLDTRHAAARRNQRSITLPELMMVLRHGRHEKAKDVFEPAFKAWNYAIRGKTVDKRDIRVIVSFDGQKMILVTAMEVGK